MPKSLSSLGESESAGFYLLRADKYPRLKSKKKLRGARDSNPGS